MLRRLPLLGTAPKETPALSAVRAPLGPGSIGIADTSTGQLAARFAADLAIAFVQLGVHVPMTVLGYQGEPVLDGGLVAELAAHGITPTRRAVGADGVPVEAHDAARERSDVSRAHPRANVDPLQVDTATARGASREVGLFVGLPALGAYRPALSMVLGVDRPLSAWPEVLRSVRDELALALLSPRVGLAPLLATALIQRGFLPRG